MEKFAKHESIAKNLDAQFFLHILCLYGKGLNENTNGLIRQYFPKNNSIQPYLRSASPVSWINLITVQENACGMKTPNQVFFKDFLFVALRC